MLVIQLKHLTLLQYQIHFGIEHNYGIVFSFHINTYMYKQHGIECYLSNLSYFSMSMFRSFWKNIGRIINIFVTNINCFFIVIFKSMTMRLCWSFHIACIVRICNTCTHFSSTYLLLQKVGCAKRLFAWVTFHCICR